MRFPKWLFLIGIVILISACGNQESKEVKVENEPKLEVTSTLFENKLNTPEHGKATLKYRVGFNIGEDVTKEVLQGFDLILTDELTAKIIEQSFVLLDEGEAVSTKGQYKYEGVVQFDLSNSESIEEFNRLDQFITAYRVYLDGKEYIQSVEDVKIGEETN